MFSIEKDNKKMGAYLKKLIEKSEYPSHRQFCKAYLREQGIDPNDEEVRKMANRLSQILNGTKAIQTYDLPIFTKLLRVSCEQILSCGKTFVPTTNHVTNYEIALSKNEKVWKEYVEREDRLILNSDEYNKTILDYAIEFKNYGLIKYLMDRGDIWFVDASKYDCYDRVLGFNAGTNIKGRELSHVDWDLIGQLKQYDAVPELRQQVIALALENKDFDILTEMRAREIPALYSLCLFGRNSRTHCQNYYDDDVVEAVANSDDGEVFKYYSEEFLIVDKEKREHQCIYPFLGELIEKLVKRKNKYAEPVIRKAIEHNQHVLDEVSQAIAEATEIVQNKYAGWNICPIDAIKKEVMDWNFSFVSEDGFVGYLFPRAKRDYIKHCTNVIRTDVKTDDFLISTLIDELNKLYDAVKNIEPVVIPDENVEVR